MKPERYVLIWKAWAMHYNRPWQGRELRVPIIPKFNPFEQPNYDKPRPSYDYLAFRRRNVGGFLIVECEGVIVHDGRVVA